MTGSFISAQPRRVPLRVYGVIVAGILAISAAAIFIRYAQAEGVPSLVIAAARLSIAALLLTPVVLWRYRLEISLAGGYTAAVGRAGQPAAATIRLSQGDALLALAAGLFLALHFATWVTSLEYTSVLISVVFVTTGPIWVALIEVFLLQTRLPRLVGVGLLVAIVGGFIIGFGSTGGGLPAGDAAANILGGGLSLAGAITFAGYLTIGRRLRAHLPVIPYIWLVYSSAGVALALAVLVTGTPITIATPTAALLLLALAVFPQLIGHSAMNYAVGYLPATIVSTIAQLEPISSAILAFIVLGETPLPVQVLGSLVILGGVLLANSAHITTSREKTKNA